MDEKRTNTTGGSQAPSDPNLSNDQGRSGEDQEGSIRKASESSTSREAFSDDYEVEQENEISHGNMKSEDENS
jgi:hypothetical protein